MAGPMARRICKIQSYSGTTVASLRLAVALLLASSAGGCAVSGQFGSWFGKSDGTEAHAEAGADVAGSIGQRRAAPAASTAGLPAETDLVFARMAIVDVLKRDGKVSSAPWENPSSGARGTVTPIAADYQRDGETCREFLASYVKKKGYETWMQGEACREKKGVWEVKSLRPWTRS
jgi:surface antigen